MPISWICNYRLELIVRLQGVLNIDARVKLDEKYLALARNFEQDFVAAFVHLTKNYWNLKINFVPYEVNEVIKTLIFSKKNQKKVIIHITVKSICFTF